MRVFPQSHEPQYQVALQSLGQPMRKKHHVHSLSQQEHPQYPKYNSNECDVSQEIRK